MTSRRSDGFTLVEVMVGLLILVTLFGSMVLAYLGVKSLNVMARHKMQAMQVVRGQMEQLKATPFANLANSNAAAAFDSGSDGVFGTADDVTGTLGVSIQDWVDYDGDGNTAESQVDVDGNGANDTVAAPIRVTFTWNEWVLGQSRTLSVSADTLIAQ